jgi:hypothetical protein
MADTKLAEVGSQQLGDKFHRNLIDPSVTVSYIGFQMIRPKIKFADSAEFPAERQDGHRLTEAFSSSRILIALKHARRGESLICGDGLNMTYGND